MTDLRNEPVINTDFFADLAQWARDELARAGYKVGSATKPDEMIAEYLNASRRHISAQPRRVLFSREFKCPPDLRVGVDEIQRKAERGENLRPHQSTSVSEPDFDDGILNDWDVHHFHLGTTAYPRNPTYVGRTRALLFARVTADTMYFICVISDGHAAFAEQEILKTIHRNWPDSIAQFQLCRVAGEKLTENNIKALRGVNCNATIAMEDGKTYFPPGGGYVSSGRNAMIVFACARIVATCRRLEAVVREEVAAYRAKTPAADDKPPRSYNFKLQIEDGGMLAIDVDARLAFRFPAALGLQSL
jgi:hypothetical protein